VPRAPDEVKPPGVFYFPAKRKQRKGDQMFGPEEDGNPTPGPEETPEEVEEIVDGEEEAEPQEAIDGDEPEEEVEPYSPEEIQEIGLSKLDPKRIPKELEPYYKAMQADYTRKTQAVAEERRKAEEERKAKEEPAAKKEPKTFEEFYDQDPQGVMTWINSEIARLAEESPYTNAVQIENLRDKKLELKDYGKQKEATRTSQYMANVEKAIPGFNSKRKELAKHATDDLGYTMDDISTLSDPSKVGESAAIKFMAQINKSFELANAGKSLKSKEVKQPTKVELAGTGGFKTSSETNLTKLYESAKTNGTNEAWAAYFDAKSKRGG